MKLGDNFSGCARALRTLNLSFSNHSPVLICLAGWSTIHLAQAFESRKRWARDTNHRYSRSAGSNEPEDNPQKIS
jgi:hypothetical protein